MHLETTMTGSDWKKFILSQTYTDEESRERVYIIPSVPETSDFNPMIKYSIGCETYIAIITLFY